MQDFHLPEGSRNPSAWGLPRLGSTTVLIVLCLFLGGCPGMRPTTVPMGSMTLQPSSSNCSVIFLPGVLDKPKDFERHGFARVAREAGLDLHLVAADAHLAYYRERSAILRLRQDLIQPLIDQDQKVWLVGVSLGGVGSLLYSRNHPSDIEGIVLLAPFLGDDEVIEEIRAAGGPLDWTPPEQIAEDDVGRKVWSWIRTWHGLDQDRPDFYLGYGESDDFAPSNGMLAELLDEQHVALHPGGHNWKAWVPLWKQLAESGIFEGCGGAG